MFLFTSQDGVSPADRASSGRSMPSAPTQRGEAGGQSFADLYSSVANTGHAKPARTAIMDIANGSAEASEQESDEIIGGPKDDPADDRPSMDDEARPPTGLFKDRDVLALAESAGNSDIILADLRENRLRPSDVASSIWSVERRGDEAGRDIGKNLSNKLEAAGQVSALPTGAQIAESASLASSQIVPSSLTGSPIAIGHGAGAVTAIVDGPTNEAHEARLDTSLGGRQGESNAALRTPISMVLSPQQDALSRQAAASNAPEKPTFRTAINAVPPVEQSTQLTDRPVAVDAAEQSRLLRVDADLRSQSRPVDVAGWPLGSKASARNAVPVQVAVPTTLVSPLGSEAKPNGLLGTLAELAPLDGTKVIQDSGLPLGQTNPVAQAAMTGSAMTRHVNPGDAANSGQSSETSEARSTMSERDLREGTVATANGQTTTKQPDIAHVIPSVAQVAAQRVALAQRISADPLAKEADRFSSPSEVEFTIAAAPTSESRAMTGPMPVAATAVAQGMAGQIARAAVGAGGVRTELILDPEELGKVRLHMVSDDRTITLHLMAERPETLELLRRNIETLEQEFRELGFSDVNFTFGEQATSDSQSDTSTGTTPTLDDMPAAEGTETPQNVTRAVSNGQLDIRL